MSVWKKRVAQVSVVLAALQSISVAQAPKNEGYEGWQVSKTSGISFFNPSQVFGGEISFKELPELSHINLNAAGEIGDHMTKLNSFLMSNGIPFGLGVNQNRDSAFDLYLPFIDILLDEPAAMFGTTRESEVGKLHFITHDSTHLYFGMPGPRLKDLQDLPKTKEKMKRILMDIEASASVWTSVNHVKWYWRFREMTQNPDRDFSKFDQYNRGLRSIGRFNDHDYTDLLQAYMSGQFRKMVGIYSKNISFDTYKEAKAAQVPMLFSNFEPKLGSLGEKLLIKYGFPVILPLAHMYDSKFGYLNLIEYAGMQADFYLSDWYVTWADTFQIGEDLDTLEKNLKRKMDDLRRGKNFADVTAPKKGVFETMFVRNAVTHLGRKLIEFEFLDKQLRAKGQPLFTETDLKDIRTLINQAKALNEQALALKDANREILPAEFQMIRNSALVLMNKAEARFPIDRYFPLKFRPSHTDYKNFWKDSFAIVLPRPEGVTKFLSARGLWAEALRQRLAKAEAEAKGKMYIEVDLEAKPIVVGDLEKQLAREYNMQGRKGKTVLEATGPINERTEHLSNLELTRRAVQTQVLKVFLPQISLIPDMPLELRQQIYDTAEDFAAAIDKRIVQFKDDYEKRFVEYSRDESIKQRLLDGEANIKWAVELSLNSMIEIINILEKTKDISKVKNQLQREIAVIEKHADNIKMNRMIQPTIGDMIKKVTPVKTGLFRTVCSAVTRMCINQDLSRIIREIPNRPFIRSQDQKVDIVFVDQNGKELAQKPEMPKNAAIVIAMNHDNASLDGMYLQEVARLLGVDRNILLTTEDAWPHIDLLKKVGIKQKDKDILFKQDKELKQKVINAFKGHKGDRISFSIFPEGELPFWHTQFPLFANFGAFNIARSAAHALGSARPVYYVEVMSNFLRATTDKANTPIRIEIYQPELVPTGAVGERDSWVETRRQRFESRANAPHRRGGQMVDMIEREKISRDGRIYVSDEVREFRTTGEFFQDRTERNTENAPIISCKAKLGGL